MSAVGGWLGGYLADRIGRVRTLQIAILWFAVFSFFSGLAQNFEQLFAARALLGLGFGGGKVGQAARTWIRSGSITGSARGRRGADPGRSAQTENGCSRKRHHHRRLHSSRAGLQSTTP